ncbi:MAG: hypothetical protein ACRDDH_00050 [Cetobacterium sp.]|uniref:hypothetical protein n=1 Tax=Cetobacterium sp. TaxID=2071632 RepID=UPI003EE45A77
MAGERSQGWIDEINITQTKNEEFQQAFSSPLLYDELDITSRSHADFVFDKMPVWNEQNTLTAPNDQQLEFQIHHPQPVRLDTICISLSGTVSGLTGGADENFQVMPLADFFNQLFNCSNVNIGQNSCNIDHLDTYGDIFDYTFKRLFTDNDYQNHLGRIDGMIPDSPGNYQIVNDVIPDANESGRARTQQLFSARTAENTACVRGVFRPPNLFFQKRKILPPYVPLRIILKRNPVAVFLKKTAQAANPAFQINSAKIRFMSYNMKAGIYDSFREQYDKNKTRFPPLDMPVNPYVNPSAIYEFFDVRASQFTIPGGIDNVTQPIRFNSNTPKAIIFCISSSTKTNQTNNHLQFSLNELKNYSVLRDSQPLVSCAVDRHLNCSSEYQDMYLRVRNMLDHYLTNETNSLRYADFAGGAGILCENLNFANNLFTPARQDVGNIELKLQFVNPTPAPRYVYVFLIYDQKLIIDETFNAHLITSV